MNSAAILAAVDLSISLLSRAQQVSLMIKAAQQENRDLTAAELQSLAATDDAAEKALADAIAQAKSEGR